MTTSIEKYKIKQTEDKYSTRSQVGGVSAKVFATVENEKVMIKGENTKESFVEYFAYRLGTKLGLNVNKVKLVDCGRILGLSDICSVHWWEEKFRKIGEVHNTSDSETKLMKFFDKIMNNDDRHGGNFGRVDGELFLIDHGLCYPWHEWEDDSWDKRVLERAIEDPYCAETVKKFAKLTKRDIVRLVTPPKDIDISSRVEKDFFDKIVNRILKARSHVRKYIKQHGGQQYV